MLKTPLKFLLLISLFCACSKNDAPMDFEKDESIGLSVIDSFTVKASTILLDSIQTSGSGNLILGQINDPDFGKIKSSTFFPLQAENAFPEFTKASRFDSLKLSFEYAGYHYGDTTKNASFEVFQLNEEIKTLTNPKAFDPDEKSLLSATGVLYNNSRVPYGKIPLGQIQFRTKPGSKDSVNIKLNQQFGQALFSLIYDKDVSISTHEGFNKYFKGLAIVPSGNEINSITGYKSASLKMRVYYSENNAFGIRISKNLVFRILDSVKQFNSIMADRTATALKDLSFANRQIPFNLTSNRGYIQAGTGIATKISFPHLQSFLMENSKIVNKAEIVIDIPGTPPSQFLPPKNLNLIIADQKNKPQKIIPIAFQQGDQFAMLQNVSSGLPYSGRYIFNVTEYLNELRQSKSTTDIPLLISVPISRLNKSLERTMVGGPGDAKAKIKLNIFYTQFK